MQKDYIIDELIKHDSTFMSFFDRGPWGDNRYRGNCSGWYHAFLIWKYNIQKMAELFSGGGTGYDVCQDMKIAYVGADLNPNPVRPGILNVNAVTDEVPEQFLDADMIFMHPPYGAEIKIPYAGNMYEDSSGELSKYDLGQMPWNIFMKTLNEIVMKYYAAMAPGAQMGILMGDVRRAGFHSMFTDIVKPGELQQVIIKKQNNCRSDGHVYKKRNFVPIEHEYLMIVKKIAPYIIDFQVPIRRELDIRNSQNATWRDVVSAVLRQYKNPITLTEIYKQIEGHEKCKFNPHWKDKVRQVLQSYSIFQSTERGVWTLVV